MPYLTAWPGRASASTEDAGAAHWLATVLNAYRVCLDAWWRLAGARPTRTGWELACCSSRPWSTGLLCGFRTLCAKRIPAPLPAGGLCRVCGKLQRRLAAPGCARVLPSAALNLSCPAAALAARQTGLYRRRAHFRGFSCPRQSKNTLAGEALPPSQWSGG